MARWLTLVPLLGPAACLSTTSTDGDDAAGDSDSDGDGDTDGDTDTDDVPPEICREPGEPAGTWLTPVTAEVGLARTETIEPLATGIVSGDLDGDGWSDLVAAVFPAQRQPEGSRRMHFVFLSREDPLDPEDATRRTFVDHTDASGLFATRDGAGGRGASVWSLGDLDDDGDLDAIGCPGSGEDSVVDGCAAFLNDGQAHFAMAPPSALEDDVFWVPSSAMLDYDLDGVLDFWPGTVGQWAYGPALTSAPRLYRGLGGGRFEDASAAAGLPDTFTDAGNYRINFGVTSCDVDLDGDRDVLLADYYQQPNFLYRNDGGTFVDVAESLGVAHDDLAPATVGGHTFSIACGDLDDDGDADLMTAEVKHAWAGDTSDHSEILRNDTPAGEPLARFVRPGNAAMGIERTYLSSGDWNDGDNLPFFADLDLDGRKDILLFSSNYPQAYAGDPEYTHAWLWRQNEEGTFEDYTAATPFGDPAHQTLEGAVLVDFDGDGDLDVIAGRGTFNSDYIGITNTIDAYRNDVGQDSNWTRIRLAGSGAGGANRSAIGAHVTVEAGGRVQHQEVLGSWGHSNTQSDVLTFGLGAACAIDRIEVRWPDAARSATTVTDVRANYEIEIVQGSDGVRYRVD
jgi:hypothetical protein